MFKYWFGEMFFMTKLTAEDVIRDGCAPGEENPDDWREEEIVRDNRVERDGADDFFAGPDPLITLKYMGCGTGLCALVGAGLAAWGGYKLRHFQLLMIL